MQKHQITVERTAFYYSMGAPGPNIRFFWIVCHGYGQQAADFLKHFHMLDKPDHLVLAPEGLNRFYLKGFSGNVGATWMTRYERMSEISDYSDYLQRLYDEYVGLLPDHVRIVLLGFSQGCATLCRWIHRNQPRFNDLVLWAGLPPEDIDYTPLKDYLSDKNLYLLYGTSDPLLTPDRMEELHDIESRNGIDFTESAFTGGHEITDDALQQFVDGITK